MILFLSNIRTIEYEPCLIILVVAVVLEEVYIFSCQRIIRCTGMAGSFRQERDVVHAESEEILRRGRPAMETLSYTQPPFLRFSTT